MAGGSYRASAQESGTRRLLGIAAAPDFTEWGFSVEEKETLNADGRLERRNPYGPEPSVTYLGFAASGAGTPASLQPDRPHHPDPAWSTASWTRMPMGVLIKLLSGPSFIRCPATHHQGAGHRLSEPHEIHAILTELVGLVERIK